MRIAVISDTHSRHATVALVIEALHERGIAMVVHCGDIEDVRTVEMFRGLEAHFVFGNCDDDRPGLRAAISAAGLNLHEPFGNLELAGKKLAFVHGDDKTLLRDIEQSGHFDFLFYGHTHQAEEHQTGPTRVINPGALHRARPKSFLLLALQPVRVKRSNWNEIECFRKFVPALLRPLARNSRSRLSGCLR